MTTVRIVGGPGGPLERALAPGERLVLGRGEDAPLRLFDGQASRHHLALEAAHDGVVVTDLGSSNGTFLGQERLPPRTPRRLPWGSALRVGALSIELHPPRVAAASGPAGPRRLRDDYEAEGELGRGAFGVVYAARHRASGRRVAIKGLEAGGGDAAARERFLREARVRIDSPHVVAVLDLRDEGERVYLVMELVDGPSLAMLLAERGRLDPAEVQRTGLGAARGLAAAHALGIVHRDVKPANVLLGRDGAVKLADFGIARERGSVLTATGTGLGTLSYVAPEQAEDAKRAGPAADLYALGATLYHTLAGQPPFDSKDPRFFEHLFQDDPPALRRLRPDAPPRLASLVHQLLEKEPEDRMPSAAAVAAALERIA
ncbi:MAG: protein kinase [Planctomycetota bacterium]